MANCAEIFTSKRALIWHMVFFSFGLLQKEFDLTLLWFIMNLFVTYLLIQTFFKDNGNWELITWYIYVLSFITDFLCICAFGGDLRKGKNMFTYFYFFYKKKLFCSCKIQNFGLFYFFARGYKFKFYPRLVILDMSHLFFLFGV